MKNVSRRAFLYGSAAAAGATLLSACSGGDGEQKPHKGNAPGTAAARAGAKVGSQTTPMPKPASFQQSPSLDHKGLPAVEQRLPDSPYVVPHRWVSRGKYGGAIRTCVFGTTGLASAGTNKEFFYGFSPTRWLNDGVDIGPGKCRQVVVQFRRHRMDDPFPHRAEVVGRSPVRCRGRALLVLRHRRPATCRTNGSTGLPVR